MEILIDLLKSAKGEIIAGILFALLDWVYSRFRRITRLYKRQKEKQKLERMKDDFIELCKSGDAVKVEEAIMNGANVNAKDNDGMTAFFNVGSNKRSNRSSKNSAESWREYQRKGHMGLYGLKGSKNVG